MSKITGRTALCAIVADPILHVRTPGAINRLLERRGVDGIMVPFHVAAADLADVVAALKRVRNLAGFIATVPHKSAMLGLCDTVTDQARLVGAVNVVRRTAEGELIGAMFDGLGFVAGLRQAGIDPAGRSTYLAGAGGAASAIAFALVEAGVARLTIANRTRARSEALAQRLAERGSDAVIQIGDADPSGHDLVVNATSLGLRADDALPLDVGRLNARQVVAEIIMEPETTALLAAGRERGCRVHGGWPMLACQLDMMADFMGLGVSSGAAAADAHSAATR